LSDGPNGALKDPGKRRGAKTSGKGHRHHRSRLDRVIMAHELADAGLRGKILDGGNPFEGTRSRPYPHPTQDQAFSHSFFGRPHASLDTSPFVSRPARWRAPIRTRSAFGSAGCESNVVVKQRRIPSRSQPR
jgi:hypothetical protein